MLGLQQLIDGVTGHLKNRNAKIALQLNGDDAHVQFELNGRLGPRYPIYTPEKWAQWSAVLEYFSRSPRKYPMETTITADGEVVAWMLDPEYGTPEFAARGRN